MVYDPGTAVAMLISMNATITEHITQGSGETIYEVTLSSCEGEEYSAGIARTPEGAYAAACADARTHSADVARAAEELAALPCPFPASCKGARDLTPEQAHVACRGAA
jgi:hypothetical protein